MSRQLNVTEAAHYVGMTVDELIRSRQRGLAPGKLGYTKDGHLYFDRDALTPPPRGERDGLTPKQTLQAEAEQLGVDFTDRTTIPELEQLIAEAAVEEE